MRMGKSHIFTEMNLESSAGMLHPKLVAPSL